MSNLQLILTQENQRPHQPPEKHFLAINKLEQSYDYANRLVENREDLPLEVLF